MKPIDLLENTTFFVKAHSLLQLWWDLQDLQSTFHEGLLTQQIKHRVPLLCGMNFDG